MTARQASNQLPITDTPGLQIIKELCRLPYETCWFEAGGLDANGQQRIYGALCVSLPDRGRIFVFVKDTAGWCFRCVADEFPTFFAAPGEFMRMNCTPREETVTVSAVLGRVSAFLSALHCTNVSRQLHPPSEKLQKARAKKGKAPLFSYWTLQLGPKNERGQSLGGTHASPRVHLRRGHPRQYAPGQYTWVQPHAVGHRELGMVHKDYSAGPGLTP